MAILEMHTAVLAQNDTFLTKASLKIWSNVVKKWRKTDISMGFFDILHKVYIYKHEVVFIEIPE